jgi:hypothetical protein
MQTKFWWGSLKEKRPVVGFCEYSNEPLGFYKLQEILWLVEQQVCKEVCGVFN